MSATPEDLANGIKLLERLRTGELSVTQGSGNPTNPGDTFAMLQRVEGVLRAVYKRAAEPIGDGGPAFPCEWDYINSNRAAANGMTLRDHFAAKAMLGIMTEPIGTTNSLGQYLTEAEPGDAESKGARMARAAYVMADAMLKARQS
jgi:hypothetical protein